MTTQKPADAHTPIRRFRAPDLLWDAYETVCARLGYDRSEDLLNHIRATIREHGTPEEVAALEQAEAELAERRARKGGRPRKTAE
ncbi:hypothetical protein [Nonomuraea sp. NPDC005650]|uniref:hypothetical protein n=1 Tax=Nonomuraea sp. NPDC005650 TaxID=3157045 RepID=UPI0033AE49AB